MVATMNDVFSTKDFYDHEVRISLVENAIINIDKRFLQVDKRFEQVDRNFEQVDKRFDKLENRIDTQFNKIIYAIGALAMTTIGTLITLIFKIH